MFLANLINGLTVSLLVGLWVYYVLLTENLSLQHGPPGLQGSPGPRGPQGLQGPLGPFGDTGPKGPTGKRGALGQRGPQGDQGPQGKSGISGVTGPRGEAGIIGARGPRGKVGAVGPVGPVGLKGVAGPKGIKGTQGQQGPRGIKGNTGPRGKQGLQGDQGAVGDIGDTGPQGLGGIQGPPGNVGVKGIRGPTGLQGPQGPVGAVGAVGYQGPQGPQGPQGIGIRDTPSNRTFIMNLKFGDAAVEIPIDHPWTFVVLTFTIDGIKVSRKFFKSIILEHSDFSILITAPEHGCCDKESTFEYYYRGEGSLIVDQRPDTDILVVILDSIGWYSTTGNRTWNNRTGWDAYKLINITVY